MDRLHQSVSSLIASVAESVVMPRFQTLATHEISEKSLGEIVTIADHEAEFRLHEGLTALEPDACVIGEEACEQDPALLQRLASGRVWVIDPIDGTSNFAAGREPFGIIIALLEDGVTRRGWLYDPVARRMCHAILGGGAFVGETPLTAKRRRRARPVAALATQFMTPERRAEVEARAEPGFERVPIPRCAAAHYPMVAFGEHDVALFQRTLPWDHAAGALLLTEADGRVSHWDGTDYVAGRPGLGLVAAVDEAAWRQAMAELELPRLASDVAADTQR